METQTIHFNASFAHYVYTSRGDLNVVVLHGWAASLKQWEWLLPILDTAGYSAYAVDLLGHGYAPRLSPDHTIEDYLDHLRQWMKALDIHHPVLLGHSMGGYLGLKYALEHPDTVRGLILVDPLYSHHQFDNYHQLARRVLRGPEALTLSEFLFRHIPLWLIKAGHYLKRSDFANAPATLLRQLALDYKRADPHIVQTLSIIGDLRPRLAEVTVPTLVTWGCRDELLFPDSFGTLVDLLPAAHGHCFTGVGHHPHLARTQRFVEMVVEFLRQVEDDGRLLAGGRDGR